MTSKSKHIAKRRKADELAAAIKGHLDLDECTAVVTKQEHRERGLPVDGKLRFVMRKENVEGAMRLAPTALDLDRDYLLNLAARWWLTTAQNEVKRLVAAIGIEMGRAS